MKEKLLKYFSIEDVNKLFKMFANKSRTYILNDSFFVKVSKNDQSIFSYKMLNEIELYKKNSNNLFLPELVDYYIDDNYIMFVLRKIHGTVLSEKRYNFDANISNKQRVTILRCILNIPNINILGSLDNEYNRSTCLNKYLDNSKEFLESNLYNKIIQLRSEIISEDFERVISHGDLIGPNVILDDNNPFFIDWEYVSYKPKYYDSVYFCLFSKKYHSVDILYDDSLDINVKESLKDGIIICLKEICNNAKLYGKLDKQIVDNNINRWVNELSYILEKYL